MQDSANIINTFVVPALAKAGIQTIHTGQISIFLQTTINLEAGWSLTCDTSPVKTSANGNFSNLPGSIVLAHGAFIDASTAPDGSVANDVEVHDCAVIIPQWYVNPSVASSIPCSWNTSGPGCGLSFIQPWKNTSTYADLDAIRANMAIAGDKALKIGRSAKTHDLAIYGFDNCVWADTTPGILVKNLSMDCNVGFYMSQNGGGNTLKDFDSNPFLTKQTLASTQLFWDVKDIEPYVPAGGGPPLCRVTIQQATTQSGNPAPDLSIFGTAGSYISSQTTPHGDPYRFPMWISGPSTAGRSCTSAGTGPNGSSPGWAFQNVTGTSSTITFDLTGSVFACYFAPSCMTPALTSQGDWLGINGIIRISGSIANLQTGMLVSSTDSSWPSCGGSPCKLTINAIFTRATGPDPNDGYNGYIVVSQPPTSASAGTVTLSFSNPPSTSLISPNQYIDDQPCVLNDKQISSNNNPVGNCVIFHAAQRYVAGYSEAGQATSRLPSSRGGTYAAGVLIDSASGVRGINIFTFDHYYAMASIDNASCDILQPDGDAIGQINNSNKTAIYLAGSSRGCTFATGGSGNKPGAALVSDLYSTTDDTTAADILTSVNVSSFTQFALGTISLGTTVPAIWPTIGVAHICIRLTVMEVATRTTPRMNMSTIPIALHHLQRFTSMHGLASGQSR